MYIVDGAERSPYEPVYLRRWPLLICVTHKQLSEVEILPQRGPCFNVRGPYGKAYVPLLIILEIALMLLRILLIKQHLN